MINFTYKICYRCTRSGIFLSDICNNCLNTRLQPLPIEDIIGFKNEK